MAELYISPTNTGTLTLISGSSDITGDGTLFKSSDVNKQIIVRTTGKDYTYTIITVTDSTHITVNQSAEVNQSTCFFTMDRSQVDLFDNFAYSFNFNIANIRDAAARNSNYSKTITIPGTKQNNIILGHIFEINADSSFNPNLRADAIVMQNTIQVFRGNMQLLKVNKNDVQISYDISIFGAAGDLFTKLSTVTIPGITTLDKLITNLDLSQFNHTTNKANQVASWTATKGSGYVYPLINNGLQEINTSAPNFSVNNIAPAIYVKGIVDSIFKSVGFTYTSNFFESDLFKALIIPSYKSQKREAAININLNVLNINAGSSALIFNIKRKRASDGLTEIIFTQPYAPIISGASIIDSFSFNATDIFPGDKIFCVLSIITGSFEIRDTGNSFEVLYTAIDNQLNASFKASYITSHDIGVSNFTMLYDNDSTSGNYDPLSSYSTITGNHTAAVFNLAGVLPDKIKQRDFLLWIIQMFNLYLAPDPFDYYNLIIEPRDDFYSAGQVIDWTDKLDISKEIALLPMQELDWKYYILSYTDDGDYYNTYYKNNFTETYGEKIIGVNNDFLTQVKEITLGFSPTPSTGSVFNELVLPTILNAGIDTIPNDYRGNIRILYYGGLKTGNWVHSDISGNTSHTTYPYAGHLDDPQTAIIDINFEQPKILFWDFKNPSQYPTSNLFNNYYSNFIAEISDKNAKLVQMYLNLSVKDIYTLDFRNSFYIDGAYYRLNIIQDYNSETGDSTYCEFIKINGAVSDVQLLQNQPALKQVDNQLGISSKLLPGQIIVGNLYSKAQPVDLSSSDIQAIQSSDESGNTITSIRTVGIMGYPISPACPADGAVLVYNKSLRMLVWSETCTDNAFLQQSFSNGFS